jgi:hypothetical protein
MVSHSEVIAVTGPRDECRFGSMLRTDLDRIEGFSLLGSIDERYADPGRKVDD